MYRGTVSSSRRNRRRGRGRLSLLLRLLLVFLLLGMGWVAIIQYKIHNAPQSGNSTHADVGIVLGASLWNNEPSPALRERLQRALTLYKNGQVDRLIVSGGLDYNGSTLSEAEGMRNYLVREGVPEQAVVMEPLARSTYENVLFSKRIMDTNNWKTSILITHDYHAARSYNIARFLKMQTPTVSSMNSQVMWMPWHKARETLAFTKWELDKLRLKLGGS